MCVLGLLLIGALYVGQTGAAFGRRQGRKSLLNQHQKRSQTEAASSWKKFLASDKIVIGICRTFPHIKAKSQAPDEVYSFQQTENKLWIKVQSLYYFMYR
jgi:hypothetical protein